MSRYSSEIAIMEHDYLQAQELQKTIDSMQERLKDMRNQHVVMLEAQQLLATVSDANTTRVLDYIRDIINKALGEMFPHDERRIYMEHSMHNGQYAHINIKLTASNGRKRDFTLQSGTGLRQIVSFLFVLSLVEIRKGRRLIIMDELLSGLHPVAKGIVKDIIEIFAEEGFQFVMVEYGMNNVGKIYLVEKPNAIASVTPLGGEVYRNEVFVFNRPPEDVDLSIRVEEGEDKADVE